MSVVLLVKRVVGWFVMPPLRLALLTTAAIVLPAAALLRHGRVRRTLVWGPKPIISNRYWSGAMRAAGWDSMTLMRGVYSINEREDFDRYIDDLVPRWFRPKTLRSRASCYLAALFVIRHAGVLHIPMSGGPLDVTPLRRWEATLLRWAGVRVIALPYGGDFYRYSRVMDTSLRQGLLLSYPDGARRERDIAERVDYWVRNADALLSGYQIDGLGRWDVCCFCHFVTDVELWKPRDQASDHDGRSGPVRILHAPNHRGFKGTEFVVAAVEELQRRGLHVELELLEGVPNSELRERMASADIHVDQLIATGYAMNAIEAMASGLPVIANLENEAYTRLFRRWSYLDECPVVSTTPETVTRNLEVLIRNPELRRQLGSASRLYAEKYHSYATAQYVFGAVYDKILDGHDVDLMRLFHPITSEYNRRRPRVEHPLCESRLPAALLGGAE